MGHHLVLTIRLHGDGQGSARYHGMASGGPEWPPSPARVFQALVAGSARGGRIPTESAQAFEWLEGLPPPLIAAPRANRGARVDLYVPNNDADALDDPRDVSGIRTKKVVHPTIFEEGVPLLYAWPLPDQAPFAGAVVASADDLYQLGRGVDMAWAVGDVVDDRALDSVLSEHRGALYRPEPGATGRGLACPTSGSLASLVHRHDATKIRVDGKGRAASILFMNAPKARFLGVVYARSRRCAIYELRDPRDDGRSSPWPLHSAAKLVCAVRDGAAARLRAALPDEGAAIERAVIGRKADGSDACPSEDRVRIVPLPTIGHKHADRAIRRLVIEVPSGAPVRAADVEWAFSGLQPAGAEAAEHGPVLTPSEGDDMLRRYQAPSRRWRSVTAVALPERAKRRRIEPSRRIEEAKSASERIEEEKRAVAAVADGLRHAGIHARLLSARVQREPFEGRGSRAESFADGTRFAKERLWHVEIELDRVVPGPLVVGDGRFLGLGVMAPVDDLSPTSRRATRIDTPCVVAPLPGRRAFFVLNAKPVEDVVSLDSISLARALRRAVMALAQVELGHVPLGPFFSGHRDAGAMPEPSHSDHLAFHWDAARRRFLVVTPHGLDRRDALDDERRSIDILERALARMTELRAGRLGRYTVEQISTSMDDPLVSAARFWTSVTPYTVTRHKKDASAHEAIVEDVLRECSRRLVPRPKIAVLRTRGVAGRGLEGELRLEFAVAVAGPIVLGRTRYLGGGLFAPCTDSPG